MANGGTMGHVALTSEHLKTLELGFGTFRLYRNLMIGEIAEGMTINADHALELLSYSIPYYNEFCSVVYISDRKNSYSVDPLMHLETGKILTKLRGYGIVYYNDMNYRVAQLEQRFLSYPSKLFRSLEEAIPWAQQCILDSATIKPDQAHLQP